MILETIEDLYGRRYGTATVTRVAARHRVLFGVPMRTLHVTATEPNGVTWRGQYAESSAEMEGYLLGMIHAELERTLGPLDPRVRTVRAPGALA